MTDRSAPYQYDLQELHFLLWHYFKLQDHSNEKMVADKETLEPLFAEILKFARQQLSSNADMAARQGCQLVDGGQVVLPDTYEQSTQLLRELGYLSLGVKENYGGAYSYVVGLLAAEMLIGADPGFMLFHGMSSGLVKLLDGFADQALKDKFCQALVTGEVSGALCMTEPQAGSDVGAIQTKAVLVDESKGLYEITGEKIFISGGMHDLSGNIVYAVLARTSKLPGTLGLSCFIVPRFWEDGEYPHDNQVRCIRLEEKMGLTSGVAAHLTFGQGGKTMGYLLGNTENVGLKQIHTVMNYARLGTALYSVSIAASAYQSALGYANERVQGSLPGKFAFHPKSRVAIVNHADVKRMLLEMKSKLEGMRLLTGKVGYHISAVECDEPNSKTHQQWADMLTPLAKSYCSDEGWKICELAIQTYGGYGYLKEYPVERCARDIKIMSIWEGTNYHQAMDFIRDKMSYFSSSELHQLLHDSLRAFVEQHRNDETHAQSVAIIESGIKTAEKVARFIERLATSKQLSEVSYYATRIQAFYSELIIAWLLLDAILTANDIESLDEAYWQERQTSTQFFIQQVFLSTLGGMSALVSHETEDLLKSA
jgi:alkylation response protein AidB-like acyl-CoA dehydrogenase